jgi:hypothetical protein
MVLGLRKRRLAAMDVSSCRYVDLHAELLKDPLCQIDQPPAHHAVNRQANPPSTPPIFAASVRVAPS